jgi:hypothetical protein
VIDLKVKLPRRKLFDADKMAKAVENALNGLALDVQADFGVTTQTWQTVDPDFNIEKKRGRRIVSTDNKIYGYLNYGTRVRHALMSPDFSPKTRKRYIGSNKGRGGLVAVSRRIRRPGIKAREFDQAIAEKWEKLAPNVFQRAIDSEFQ